MNKKMIGITLIFILICFIGTLGFFLVNNLANQDKQNNYENNEVGDNKILIVYFSATNNTKGVAEKLANKLNGDLFVIEPVQEYTAEDLDWTNEKSRVSREHEDESLRNVKLKTTKVDNWDNYDTVLIGYPIWWGIAAWPVDSFVKSNDFTGKTVIPFCTSSSSDIGQSGEILAKEANSGNWLEGYRFNSNPTTSEIDKFVNSIK